MIEKLKMNDVSWQQLKAKMTNLRTKFVEVKKWLEGTGQGVDSGTIEDYKRKKCPFYDELHGIFAAKANISIPYMYDSLQTQDLVMEEECSQVHNDTSGQENPEHDASAEEHGKGDANFRESDLDFVFPVDDLDIDFTSEECVIDVENYLPPIVCNVPIDVNKSSTSQEERSNTSSNTQQNKISQKEDTCAFSDEELRVAVFAEDPPVSQKDEISERDGTRLSRFKQQLSERPSGTPGKQRKREIPSNASAFISDANMKRAETLHERNQIELRRVENEKTEIELNKERFHLDQLLHVEQLNLCKKDASIKDQELLLKEKEQQEKFELRKQNFELKCKKFALKEKENGDVFKLKMMELEKSERLEKLKMELDYKMQLEIAKLKFQSNTEKNL